MYGIYIYIYITSFNSDFLSSMACEIWKIVCGCLWHLAGISCMWCFGSITTPQSSSHHGNQSRSVPKIKPCKYLYYTLSWCMNLHVRSMCFQLKYIRHYKLVAFAKAEKTNQTQLHKAPAKGDSWSSARGVWQPVLSWWGWLTKNHVWI